MKHVALWIMILTGVAVASGADPVPNSRVVLAPAKRLESMRLAARVLEPRAPTWKDRVAELPDPFFRTNTVKTEVAVVETTERRSDRSEADILEEAARDIRPTGTLFVGSENYLLLGGKRYRNGDILTVTIDGIIYEIALSAIDRNSYTLRLNETESRRQLK